MDQNDRDPAPCDDAQTSAFRDQLSGLAPWQRAAALERRIRQEIAEILEVVSEDVALDRPVRSMGLATARFTRRLGAILGMELPTTLVWNHPTIRELAAILLDELALDGHVPGDRAYRASEERNKSPRSTTEPIAIVGMSCRIPGGGTSPQRFWELMRAGFDAVGEAPAERWDADLYYHPDPGTPGKSDIRSASFLDNITDFDAGFFGISPREAILMDPQQRLLLEVLWEALESAGIPPRSLAGSATGVYVGTCISDFHLLLRQAPHLVDGYGKSGTHLSILSNRLSYLFDLRGPSLTLDAACASGLGAVHLACRSLQSRECDMAIAGAASVMLDPFDFVFLRKARLLSPDGRCKTFDSSANGYVRAEGVGLVVLKRLDDALERNDPIVGVIRGSAMNQDGRTNGLPAPSSASQAALYAQLLRDTGIDPGQVTAIEAHGTGTRVGDALEMEALRAVYDVPDAPPCFLGSVKTNIGHAEPAAGIIGLIKLILCLENRMVPPHLHLETISPDLHLDGTRFRIPRQGAAWTGPPGTRLGAVSSFGFGGTKAHAIVQEAPVRDPIPAPEPPWILPLSGHDAAALRDQVAGMRAFIQDRDDLEPGHIAYTAAVRRDHHQVRTAVVGHTRRQWLEALDGHVTGAGHAASGIELDAHARLVFVFSGQGSQWPGMGRALLASRPEFRSAIQACDECFQGRAGWSIVDALSADDEPARMDQTEVAQALVFAIQVGLAAVWRALGVRPDAIVGHSVGEVAAAHMAGVLSLDQAVAIIHERGCLMQAETGRGSMAAILASESVVGGLLEGRDQALAIAAVNAPEVTVVAGQTAALEQVLATCASRDIGYRRLGVPYAFHGPQMESAALAMAEAMRGVLPAATPTPTCTLVSSVSGRIWAPGDYSPAYWYDNIRQPVRFAAAMDTLIDHGARAFVEVGPHPVLGPAMARCMEARGVSSAVVVASHGRDRDTYAAMLESLATLYRHGYEVDWSSVYPAGRCVPLPTYPFQRERFWHGELGHRAPAASPGNAPAAVAPDMVARAATRLAQDGRLSPMEERVLPRLVAAMRQELAENYDQADDQTNLDDLFYQVTWPRYQRAARVDIPAPAVLRDLVTSHIPRLLTEHRLARYQGLWTGLGDVTVGYAVRALAALGWSPAVGARISTDALACQLGVIDHFHRWLERLLTMLAEEGMLRPVAGGWEVERPLVADDPGAGLAALRTLYPEIDAEFTLVERCGASLVELLSGRRAPLEVIFPGGDLSTATNLYQDSPGSRVMNELIATTLGQVLEHGPEGPWIRVLEIGAGTGATTSYLLPRLGDHALVYDFTDLSPRFLNKAKERFSAYPFLGRRILDIELDPSAQGFEPHHYHVVVAANVLHATRDLRTTLDHVRRLLAPGGLLLLLEWNAPVRWIDLFAGALGGWWRYTDVDVRPTHPLVTPEVWRELLGASGLRDVAVLAPEEYMDGVDFPQTLIVAQHPAVDTTEGNAATPRSGPDWPFELDARGPRSGTWLLLSDSQGAAKALARTLESRGHACVVAVPVDAPGPRVAERATIFDPHDPAAVERIVRRAASDDSRPLCGIVHLLGLDVGDIRTMGGAGLMRAATTSNLVVTHVARALDALGLPGSPRLWLVTRGAQPVVPSDALHGLAQSSLWGMGKALSAEHPGWWGGAVDLDPEVPADRIAALAEILVHPTREDLLAVRDGWLHVARLSRCPAPAPCPDRLPAHGSYVITGGLGALGLRVARWLVDRGARYLVLVSRRGAASDAAQRALRNLESAGATVDVVRADVASADQMTAVFERLGATMPMVRGIVHAAFVPGFKDIQDMSHDDFVAMLRPKVLGAWNLHRATRDIELDFFVLFSSITSVWGSKSTGHYAAANHFLDGLAHYRRGLGLPGLSLSWGLWTEGEVPDAYRDTLVRLGFLELDPGRATAAMGRLLPTGCAHSAIAAMDWERFRAIYQAATARPLLDDLYNARGDVATDARSVARSPTLETEREPTTAPARPMPPDDPPGSPHQEPSGTGATTSATRIAGITDPKERMERLVDYLQDEVASVLGWQSSRRPAATQGFFELGLDSLTGLEFRSRLEGLFGCGPLSATLVFDHPTIRSLAEYLDRVIVDRTDPGMDAPLADEQTIRHASPPRDTAPSDLDSAIEAEIAAIDTLLD